MNILRLFHTIRHLQARQVWYRLWYPLKKQFYRPGAAPAAALHAAAGFPQTGFIALPGNHCFDPEGNSFHFLNISHSFGRHIDWDFSGHGRLWTYNLNYFEWLQDESVPTDDRLHTIYQYIKADPATGREPYPISLRNTNWIRFLSRHGIRDEQIDSFLYHSYRRLAAFPEYHIAANHLLENAFSLFFGAHYFNRKQWHRLAERLLTRELNEQVLPDGGHYERSPMYHSIVLERLLQCCELIQSSNRIADEGLHALILEKAGKMLGWLQAFLFADGSYAMVQDAAPGIARSPEALMRYADELEIIVQPVTLKESGYRLVKEQDWELLLNLGGPSPAYQPGHAHADALAFCLQANGRPLIVDTGIATYDAGAQRLWEKSTDAHNTIALENLSSSDIWHGFRVGRIAHVFITEETGQSITAHHDGYRYMDVIHERKYSWTHRKIIIEDTIKTKKGCKALLHLHFHPDVLLQQTGPNRFTVNGVSLQVKNDTDTQLQEYQFCAGFNKRIKAQRLRLCAADRIAVVIEF
jgi:hypothetical protein